MLYLFDEDAHRQAAKLNYITGDAYKGLITWYRNRSEVTLKAEDLKSTDVVCYHNSFPGGERDVLKPIRDRHDSDMDFMLVCFSGDTSFHTWEAGENYLKIGKDRFYMNLQKYMDDNYDVESLKFGVYTVENEIGVIVNRIFAILFNTADEDLLDLKVLKPGDLKRLCDLAGEDYEELMGSIDDITVGHFRKKIKAINKNA
jgi:hypothetical protein